MMINILITDDSATDTLLLKHLFEKEADMTVIGCAKNGKEAVEMASTLKPDLITMDIQMPIMNGYEATRIIMMNHPVPIVVISPTVNNREMNTAFQALEAGAVSVIEKPVNVLDPRFSFMRKRIISTIRAMAEIKVIKQRFTKPKKIDSEKWVIKDIKSGAYELVAIGASVGGPQALKIILSALPANFPVPIVIVQHMTVGFIAGFCQWLNDYCALPVKCISDKEELRPGTVYFAPENYHLQISKVNQVLVGKLLKEAPVAGFCPSITLLFQSIAESCGGHAVGILLTGMGKDGAEGLLDLKHQKALTLIQDEKSSVVFGMAAVAQSLGAVDKVIELNYFAQYLSRLFHCD